MDRMRRFVERGGTLLFCSHAMYYVSHFCRRALWLRDGRPQALGPVAEVVREYEAFLTGKSGAPTREEADAPPAGGREGRRPARITAVELDAPGHPAVYRNGDSLSVEVGCQAISAQTELHLGVGINRVDGTEVAAFATHLDGRPPLSGETAYRLRLQLPRLPLLKGEFTLYVFLLDESGLHVYDEQVVPSAFRVACDEYRFGLVHLEHAWSLIADSPPHRSAAAGLEVELPS
jgi:lipopolysaccharide transport system ATP-binding protein